MDDPTPLASWRSAAAGGRPPLRFLAISGSLRAASLNTALLRAAQMLAPPGLVIDLYDGPGDLPHFNPDVEGGSGPLPPPVAKFRQRVSLSDAVILSCPEYARGIPGTLKNALDWLVGCPDFSGTRVALFNASSRAIHAQAALKLTLETMSAVLVERAALRVSLSDATRGPHVIISDAAIAFQIGEALDALVDAVREDDDRG